MKLVMLHALPFDGQMWAASQAALPVESLAPSLFDLGDSIEEWAATVVEQAGSDELVVIGCSVGGSCALEVAIAAPGQVRAIVLIGAKAEVNPDHARRDEAIRLLETDGMPAAWERYWSPLFAPTTHPAIIDAARTSALGQNVASIVNGVRAFHDRRDLSSFVTSWDRPLIGISGACDVAPPPAKLRRIATGAQRCFHLVRDCGHYVNLEQPIAFEQLISDVIESITDG